jgi:plastocyanin domain-containing protein
VLTGGAFTVWTATALALLGFSFWLIFKKKPYGAVELDIQDYEISCVGGCKNCPDKGKHCQKRLDQ